MSDRNKDQKVKVANFAKLKENWDSDGASPIDSRAIEAALELLEVEPVVTPDTGVGGGVNIELRCKNQTVTVEINEGGYIEVYVCFTTEPTTDSAKATQ